MAKTGSSNVLQRYAENVLKANMIGTNLKYFAVTVIEDSQMAARDVLINDLLAKATEHDQQYEQQLHIARESAKVTLTPWLRRTGWTTRFLGQNMLSLSEMTKRPRVESEGLMKVWLTVERTVKRSFDGVKDCNARGWDLILFWLVSAKGDEEASQPFRQHFKEETIARYISYWQRFICFCFRVLENCQEFGVEFRPVQREKLHELRAKLELDEVTEEELDEEVTANARS